MSLHKQDHPASMQPGSNLCVCGFPADARAHQPLKANPFDEHTEMWADEIINRPRLVICREGVAAMAMTAAEVEGVHRAMRFYDADSLIPRLLATIEALRHPA